MTRFAPRRPRPAGLAILARIGLLAMAIAGGRAFGQIEGGIPEPQLPLSGIPSPLFPVGRENSIGPPGAGDPPFVRGGEARTGVIEVKVGQGRLLTLAEGIDAGPKGPGAPPAIAPLIAVGDPRIVDFFQVTPRHLRLLGKRLGTTDLAITSAAGTTYEYEVQVVADLDVLRAQLRSEFPEAALRLSQLREKIVVEGQARDANQVGRIIDVIESYVRSIQKVQISGRVGDVKGEVQEAPEGEGSLLPGGGASEAVAAAMSDVLRPNAETYTQSDPASGATVTEASTVGANGGTNAAGNLTLGRIATNQSPVVNLIRVPTSQQVLLKVRVAELNRTGFRQIGADLLATIPQFGTLFGTQIAGNGLGAGAIGDRTFAPAVRGVAGQVTNPRSLVLGSAATVYGTFSQGQFNAVLTALRRNNILKILAEPNLVALNGHQANFLAGGEFPVPSFSGVGAGAVGGGGTSGTQFKEFGVRLSFLPIILDDDTVRLTVDPEVSSVDFSIATTLVPGGSPVPGLNKRSSHTTVELKQGETLAIAGLMQLSLDGTTQKIPGLGDLPYIGAFFSNTTSNRVEKELIVLVTPYLVEPMAPGQVPPVPGEEVVQPNDLEFYFLNRIEGRTGIDGRSTTTYDDPLRLIQNSLIERKYLVGPSGFSK